MKDRKNRDKNAIVFQSHVFDYRKGSIIKRDGQEIFLEQRLKRLFSILLENRNDVVTRNELMDYVWKDAVVNEESITKAISDLRKFFAANGFENITIITIRKLGYKLEIGEVKQREKRHRYYFKRGLNILAYSSLVFLTVIILLRVLFY